MSRPGARQGSDGFSLLEVLWCSFILVLCAIPILDQFTATHRSGVSAGRLFEASFHAQELLESICRLDVEELPRGLLDSAGTEFVLLEDDEAPALEGMEGWKEVVAAFSGDAPGDLDRRVVARHLAGGPVLVRVELEWLRIGHDERTGTGLTLCGLMVPRGWGGAREPAAP